MALDRSSNLAHELRNRYGVARIRMSVANDNRERNDDHDQREEATGTSAVCKPGLSSMIVIGSRSIIVTTLTESRTGPTDTSLGERNGDQNRTIAS
jgi:hypothetical protein